MKQITIINGPNLNLLGKREISIYGDQPFESFFEDLKSRFEGRGALTYFQSNHEGALIDKIHEIGFAGDGIVLNAGALTHYSHALADALQAIKSPVVEVHISNIHAREAFRHTSLTAAHARGSIAGLGFEGYALAIEYLLSSLEG
ncbi:MAG: type II 3-dehydroquinate dehydratase [Saprospiraceae bacterium]|nr:type II 3-dehydroquinate dehydratase [Saprospiraceae bacterium]